LALSAVAGFATFSAVTFALGFGSPGSWMTSQFRRVFGLAPLVARAVDPNFYDGEGLLEVAPVIGRRVDLAVFMGFWVLLFASVYFFWVFRRRAI
jgi:hypothetical protein